MARRKSKVLQARKSAASRDDDSLLTRSAESLGRVIGSLQRQVQDGTRRVSTIAEGAKNALPAMPPIPDVFGGGQKTPRRKTAAARKRAAAPRKAAAARKAAPAGKARGAAKKKSPRRPR